MELKDHKIYENKLNRKFACGDIVGKKFSKLTVVSFAYILKHLSFYNCICDCGKSITLRGTIIATGRVKSCGCIRSDNKRAKNISKGHKEIKHEDNTYHIWANMVYRCSKENNQHSKYYIDNGIKVCERWLSFDNFFEDMGEKPSSKHSIDRINTFDGYNPNNCRWATNLQQNRNKTNNLMIEHDNKIYTMSELAEKLNISYSRFQYGIEKLSKIHNFIVLGKRKDLITN